MNQTNLFIYVVVFSIIPFLGMTQSFEIQQGAYEHKGKERPSIEIKLEPEPKAIKKAWKDYIKDNHDVKLKGFGFLTNKDLLEAEEVDFPAISDKTMNFYTHFSEAGGQTKMEIFASLGHDIYIDSRDYPNAYRSMRQIANRFIQQYLPDYYLNRVQNTEEELEDLQSEIEDLEDDIADNKDDIEENLQEIEDLRAENENLSKELDEKEDRLEQLMSMLEARRDKLQKVKKKVDEIN